jgi:hypothetical protein
LWHIIIAMVEDATDCPQRIGIVLHQWNFPWGFFGKPLTFTPMGPKHGAEDFRGTPEALGLNSQSYVPRSDYQDDIAIRRNVWDWI